MDAFAAFMTARYDEAEALARAAYGETGTWWRRRRLLYLNSDELVPTGALYEGEPEVDDAEHDIFIARVVVYDEGSPTDAEFDHIAACDPAHRLADIALKRAILALHKPELIEVVNEDQDERSGVFCGECSLEVYPCPTARQLGTEFSGHPDYLEQWKP